MYIKNTQELHTINYSKPFTIIRKEMKSCDKS